MARGGAGVTRARMAHESPEERAHKLAKIALLGVILLAVYCVGGDAVAIARAFGAP